MKLFFLKLNSCYIDSTLNCEFNTIQPNFVNGFGTPIVINLIKTVINRFGLACYPLMFWLRFLFWRSESLKSFKQIENFTFKVPNVWIMDRDKISTRTTIHWLGNVDALQYNDNVKLLDGADDGVGIVVASTPRWGVDRVRSTFTREGIRAAGKDKTAKSLVSFLLFYPLCKISSKHPVFEQNASALSLEKEFKSRG